MFSNVTNFFRNLINDPVPSIVTFLYMAVCILFSLIIHECAHGYVALRCGDPTAKWMGRLTLDPRKHLDPIGTICMIFLRVGWAKPVPVNPRNFRNYRRDYILVSLAGIAVNLLICIVSLLISALLAKVIWQPDMLTYFRQEGQRDVFLNVYQYIYANAVYGGSFSIYESFMSQPWLAWVQRMFLMLAQMNLGLAIFNLIPVPPLDGYRFLDEFAFRGRLSFNPQTMQIVQIVFLVVCMSGTLSGLLTTVNSAVFGALSSVFSMLI